MSDMARAMVVERGQEDWDSEFQRFPRLFEGHESIPGLTWPTTTFDGSMSVYLGNRRVDLMHLGRAHTAAISSSTCLIKTLCSQVTSLNTIPPATAVMVISRIGAIHWITSNRLRLTQSPRDAGCVGWTGHGKPRNRKHP